MYVLGFRDLLDIKMEIMHMQLVIQICYKKIRFGFREQEKTKCCVEKDAVVNYF